ncbi:MAG: peptidylprolyl isomerase [Pseudomonadota bacterium]|nr:peptidylprolyl isomerase [Pseudomonadota bacterium]
MVYLEALANKEYIVSVVFHELIFSRCALVAAILFFAGADAFANQELKNPFINDATTGAQNASRTQGVRVGNAETISGNVFGKGLGKRLNSGDPIQYFDTVRVGLSSAAALRFVDNTELVMGENSSLLINNLIFNPQLGTAEGVLNMTSGFLRYTSAGRRSNIIIQTSLAAIGIRGTVFDILASSSHVEVVVHEGNIAVDSNNKKAVLRSGEVIKLNKDETFVISKSPSLEIKKAVQNVSQILKQSKHSFKMFKTYGISNEAPVLSKVPAKCTKKLTGIVIPKYLRKFDKSKLIIMRLNTGDVFIKLLEHKAPRHIIRIKNLIRQCFYDGLQFFDVKSDFAAITGDPLNNGEGGSGKTLKSEFSKIPFIAGSVGMIRDQKDPNSADSQFFIALKPLLHLTGKYTKWGLVVHGMDKIRKLPTGRPPQKPAYIVAIQLLSDVPFANFSDR